MASVGIRDVRKAFGATRGAFVTLVGPTGSGKSTRLRMIAGLENITEIRVGERVANVPPNA